MKILILASYRGKQKYRPDNCLRRDDLDPPARYEQRVRELSGYSVPAGEMFTGQFHEQLRQGLKQIREHEQYGQTTIDLYFPSSYYRVDLREDLVHENDSIVPFDIEPLSGTGRLDYGETGDSDRVRALIERYDLVFSLLAEYDFLPLERLFLTQYGVPLILLVARSWQISVPESSSNTHLVCTADLVGQADGVSNYNHQGAVFRKLCEVAFREGFHVFEQVKQDPQQLIEIIQNQD